MEKLEGTKCEAGIRHGCPALELSCLLSSQPLSPLGRLKGCWGQGTQHMHTITLCILALSVPDSHSQLRQRQLWQSQSQEEELSSPETLRWSVVKSRFHHSDQLLAASGTSGLCHRQKSHRPPYPRPSYSLGPAIMGLSLPGPQHPVTHSSSSRW